MAGLFGSISCNIDLAADCKNTTSLFEPRWDDNRRQTAYAIPPTRSNRGVFRKGFDELFRPPVKENVVIIDKDDNRATGVFDARSARMSETDPVFPDNPNVRRL